VIAGSLVSITWSGPANAGDYITIVTNGTPDGRYANYANVTKDTVAKVLAPIDPGAAEIRYMTGQGAKVLARAPLQINAATITLNAPAEAKAGVNVTIDWTGPANGGDYVTVVPQSFPDGRYAAYANVASNPRVTVKAPAEPGPAEIRYMSGQGARVLHRRAITIVP
jgi:Ca-activated chloride channel family protein